MRFKLSSLVVLISDVLSELLEKSTAKVAGNHLEFDLALLQLVHERLRLSRLLLKLRPLIDHLLEF